MTRELLSSRSLESKLRDAITQAAQRNTRVKIRDGDNLMLIVRPSGGASWVLEYRLAGRRKPLTLGAWPALGLKSAREQATKARELVAKGLDPNEQRAFELAERRAQPTVVAYTVRKLFEAWLAKKGSSEVYLGNIREAFDKDVLTEIGDMLPADVTRQHILKILRKLEKRSALVMLKSVRMWLRQMYEFALDAELVSSSPVPSGQLTSFEQPRRGHFAAITNAGEVAPLMRAIRGYGYPVVRMALLLAAHLFQRPSELREAKAPEFDLDNAIWIIPAERTKKRREHWVPLSTQVVDMLRAQLAVVGSDEYVFPGRHYGKPLSEGTMNAALQDLGFRGKQTVHGFRATARTILEEHLGVNDRYVEKQLAHEEENKTKRAYNRAEYWAERVKMMQAWSDWLDAQR